MRAERDIASMLAWARALARGTGYAPADLLGPPDRRRPELNALQRALWAGAVASGWSAARVALVAKRNPTTVLRGIKKHLTGRG